MRIHTSLRSFPLLIVLALVMAMALPAAALAGPQDIWRAISADLYDLDVGKEPTLSMTMYGRQGTELPVDAAVAIPKGSTVVWAGELLGGDPGLDPILEVAIESGDAYDVATFTLTEAVDARLELSVPEGMVIDQGGQRRVELAWTSGGDVDRARVAVITPTEQHLVDVVPDPIVMPGTAGVMYSAETSPVASGDVLTMSGTLVQGPAPELTELMNQGQEETGAAEPATAEPVATTSEPESESTVPLAWLIIGILLIAVAAVGALLYLQLRKQNGTQDDASEPDSENAE